MEVLEKILKKGFYVKLISFSAIDYYLYSKLSRNYIYILTDANLIDISKMFENIEYGYDLFDFAIKENNKTYLVKTDEYPDFPFIIQYFTYDLGSKKFKNIFESFNHIKRRQSILKENYKNSITALMEHAKLISKYDIKIDVSYSNLNFLPININVQRELISVLLEGDNSSDGFELLLKHNFIEYYWKELYEMVNVEQIKDFHPEGNVWQHTMETFKYRKRKNLILSLALLLHDIGKAFSYEYDNKKFYKHAQIGANIAQKFLKNLAFDDKIINKVKALVKYHMLPEAIDRIPKNKLEKIKKEVDLNLLFELYRADISSSYRSLKNFYKFKKFVNL